MHIKVLIGSTPYGEDAVQLGTPEFTSLERLQLMVFKDQCLRHYKSSHGKEFPGQLKIIAQDHDFGVYHEVFGIFEETDEEAMNAILWLESHLPETWDDEARHSLGICDVGTNG